MKRKFLTLTDILIGVFVLAASTALLMLSKASGTDRLTAEISCDGKTETVRLYEIDTPYEKTVASNGHILVLSLSRDGIEVIESDCRDKICVASGRLNRHGECAVCLPAKFTVRVYSENKNSEVDVIL